MLLLALAGFLLGLNLAFGGGDAGLAVGGGDAALAVRGGDAALAVGDGDAALPAGRGDACSDLFAGEVLDSLDSFNDPSDEWGNCSWGKGRNFLNSWKF